MASFPIDKSEGSGSQGCLESSPIGPKCIIKLCRPILPCCPHSLLQNGLYLPVGNLNLATCLGMISSCHLVLDTILLKKVLKKFVDEVGASITDHNSWDSKPWEDNALEHLEDNLSIIGWAGYSFHPFGDIIHSNKNVFITIGRWEWSHEVNAPHIKHFHFQDRILRHLISLGDVPSPLAWVTP
ncbi:hypothetical protein YC2023_037667 [Brassica napus]